MDQSNETRQKTPAKGMPDLYVRSLPLIIIAVAAIASLICAGALLGREMALTCGVIAACIPALALMIYIYKSDSIEPEPAGLLFILFVSGAILLLPVRGIELLTGLSGTDIAIGAVIVVSMLEEICKFIVLRLITWKHTAFNYRFDGIVYAATLAIGFEFAETVFYLSRNLTDTAVSYAMIPGHCIFAIYLGFFYGEAKSRMIAGDSQGTLILQGAGIVLSVILHVLYDMVIRHSLSAMMTVILVILIIVLNIVAWLSVRCFSKRDRAI